MAFELKKKSTIAAESPEALFRDLRGRTVEGLLAHQADLLRDYVQNALDKPDVALQSPTGSGKTLVGLLVAEWRRRRSGERVVYLCPTNQLVHQVAAQARTQYGIEIVPFTGKKSDYAEADKAAYAMASAVAVTSYSSLFNVRPFFRDPQLIILDDAHAAENYIASTWSLQVDRRTAVHRPLFVALSSVLKSVLSATDYDRLTAERAEARWDDTWVDSLPGPALFEVADELTGVLDANVGTAGDLRYRWSWLKGHLDACHLYIARGEILIRPLIPPSAHHAPFDGAKQRVYMSATLGAGGDLERITGRRSIKRLAVPAGWEKQGIGRRLFFFPSSTLRPKDLRILVADMAMRAERSVILTTDLTREQELAAIMHEATGFQVFNARELEESKSVFVGASHAVAVVANRYDGIDFPGDECRLLMVDQLPNATNLQERFFSTRVGAGVLLNDRVMTRLVQGFGRCTRGATDYAAVVVISESVFTHLAAPERRTLLHPELQAELKFGLDQSIGRMAKQFLENLDVFLKQGAEWREADAAIVELRDTQVQTPLPGAADLLAAVPHEIDYQYAMWGGRYTDALDAARSALGCLRAPELRGYRALWHYLGGNAASLANRHGQLTDDGSAAREQYDNAARAVGSIRWLSDLARYVGPDRRTSDGTQYDPNALEVVERLEAVFERLGSATNYNFDEAEGRILQGLLRPDGVGFEAAHVELGRLLGYDAGKVETDASPDPWWRASDRFCFVFEDHAGAGSSGILDATKARQAATHDNWVRQNVPLSQTAEIVKILITPVTRAASGAMPHLATVLTFPLESFRTWARNALVTLRELKRTFRERGDLQWQAEALDAYTRSSIAPAALKAKLASESGAVTWTEG
jgi:hypothetical protein